MSFLDKDGLAYLWNKIGEKLAAIPKTMTVNVTSGNDGYTADKTFAEILAAINGGQMVRAVLDGTIYFNDVTLSGDTPVSVIIFSSVENFGQLISLFVDNNVEHLSITGETVRISCVYRVNSRSIATILSSVP